MKLRLVLLFIFVIPTISLAEVSLRIKSNYEAGVQMYENGNMKMALIFFQQGADKGEASSQSALGTHYFYGDGIEKNTAKALELFEKSAAQGDGLGNAMLGVIYTQGDGVKQDQKKAFGHSLTAANMCIPQSQDFVAMHLYRGEGIKKNIVEALMWLYMASHLGYESSNSGVLQIESEIGANGLKEAKEKFIKLKEKLKCE
ncbi:tetratricopeptide repeat protein [Aliikangiella sp. IMCC44632]